MSANQAPQCSTLRRHWEAMQGGASSASASTSQSAAPSSPTATASTQSSGGFFAWLKSLFS
jgi:hypothetical protein